MLAQLCRLCRHRHPLSEPHILDGPFEIDEPAKEPKKPALLETVVRQVRQKEAELAPKIASPRSDPRFIDPETGRYSEKLYMREYMRQRRALKKLKM